MACHSRLNRTIDSAVSSILHSLSVVAWISDGKCTRIAILRVSAMVRVALVDGEDTPSTAVKVL